MTKQVAASRRAERARKSPRRGDAREGDLLRGAEAMLAAGEFDDASIADLADAAGLSRPTFYFYFASKDALLAHLVERALTELAERMAPVVDDEATIGDPPARLEQAIGFVAQTWVEHRRLMCAAVELADRLPEIDDAWRGTIEAVVEIASASLYSHEIPRLDGPTQTRRLIRALVWATERNLYNLARADGSARELKELERDLALLWKRTLGLEG